MPGQGREKEIRGAGKVWGHFRTITHHKWLVMKGCFRLGLCGQGLLHDLSKYGPTEFIPGCRYFQGNMSPNNAERLDKGYSAAWLHHKGRNKHHLDYWIDYDVAKGLRTDRDPHKGMCGTKMPIRYVVEMYVDRVSASKNYRKEAYRDDDSIRYYEKSKDSYIIHEDTAAMLEMLLTMLAVRGEARTEAFIRRRVLTGGIPYEKKILERMTRRLNGAKAAH